LTRIFADDAALLALDLQGLLDLALADEFHLLEDLAERFVPARIGLRHAAPLDAGRRLRPL